MQKITNNSDLEEFQKTARNHSQTIAFIPTMGALHDGHLALVKEGLQKADIALVSIFVNPTQFAPHEDFDAYPRDVEADMAKLEALGVQAVWLPSEKDIYPAGNKTDIHVSGVSAPLEGEFRPHFFDGVATVVARLLRAVKPDVAIFGEKDFQQLQVVRQMVAEQNINVDIIGAEIVRDENGLALSSRNAYLNEDEFKTAIQLNVVLNEFAAGQINEAQAHEKLLKAGFDKIDYCTARNAETFLPDNPDRVLAAAWIGKTRLIDNMPIT